MIITFTVDQKYGSAVICFHKAQVSLYNILTKHVQRTKVNEIFTAMSALCEFKKHCGLTRKCILIKLNFITMSLLHKCHADQMNSFKVMARNVLADQVAAKLTRKRVVMIMIKSAVTISQRSVQQW